MAATTLTIHPHFHTLFSNPADTNNRHRRGKIDPYMHAATALWPISQHRTSECVNHSAYRTDRQYYNAQTDRRTQPQTLPDNKGRL